MQNRSLIPVAQNISFELKTADTESGFRLSRDDSGEVSVLMYDERRALSLHRSLTPSSSYELDDLLDFALSVGRAIFADEKEGYTYENFAVRTHCTPEMDVFLGFELTSPDRNTEIEATLAIGEGDNFAYATAIVSLDDLVAAVSHLDAECGFGWGR